MANWKIRITAGVYKGLHTQRPFSTREAADTECARLTKAAIKRGSATRYAVDTSSGMDPKPANPDVAALRKATTQAAQINALRELVRAEQARTQALLDLQAQLPPNMSQTAFEFVRGYTCILATSKDWREVGLYELAEVFDRIEKA